MHKHIVKSVLLIIIITGCIKEDIAHDIPSCIHNDIEKIMDDRNSYIGKVSEYIFDGRTVYTFEPDGRIIADASTLVKSAACDTICHIGGYGGPDVTLCNGVKFYDNALLKRVIWERK